MRTFLSPAKVAASFCVSLAVVGCSAPEFKVLPNSGGSAGANSGGASSGGTSSGGTNSGGVSGGGAGGGGAGAGGVSSGGAAGADAGAECPGPKTAAAAVAEANLTTYTFPKINLEKHLSFAPKPTGHFTKALVSFQLKFAATSLLDLSGEVQRVLQIRNQNAASFPEDPGCFLAMVVTKTSVTLNLCGAGGTQTKTLSWVPGTWYAVSISYDTSTLSAKLSIGSGSATVDLQAVPKMSIFPIGGGLITHVGQNTGAPANSNLEGAEMKDMKAALTPGVPYCGNIL